MSSAVVLPLMLLSVVIVAAGGSYVLVGLTRRPALASALLICGLVLYLGSMLRLASTDADGAQCGQAFHAAFGELSTGGDRSAAEISADHAACRHAGKIALITASGLLAASVIAAGLGLRVTAAQRRPVSA